MRRALLAALALAVAPAAARAQGRFTFDPDRCFTCRDSREHAAAGAAIDAAAQLAGWPKRPWQRVAVVAVVGAVYEVGEEEGTRGTEYAGRPGYGFGLKDLACDLAGALAAEGLRALLRKVL